MSESIRLYPESHHSYSYYVVTVLAPEKGATLHYMKSRGDTMRGRNGKARVLSQNLDMAYRFQTKKAAKNNARVLRELNESMFSGHAFNIKKIRGVRRKREVIEQMKQL